MILEIFTVYDSKAKAFAQPFFALSVPVAVRMFTSTVNDPSTMLNRHPGDFSLFHIGSFNDDNAAVTPLVPLANLGLAAQYKETLS